MNDENKNAASESNLQLIEQTQNKETYIEPIMNKIKSGRNNSSRIRSLT